VTLFPHNGLGSFEPTIKRITFSVAMILAYLRKGPHYGKKSSSSLLYLTDAKEGLYLAEVSSFLHGL
jgi:hypothetical protein